MLMQQRNPNQFDFSPNLLPSLQSSPFQRKTIIIQPPPGLQLPSAQSLLTPTSLSINFSPIKPGAQKIESMLTELSVTRGSESEKSDVSLSSPRSKGFPVRSKIIKKMTTTSNPGKKGKKIYEISRFFVKNYIGALKATLNSPSCQGDILAFLGCSKEHINEVKIELEKLLKENPKHNRMQLYKLIVNPVLNPVFQYFLRRKVVSWIFTSSKMQDRQAHLLARKNFLHLCLRAKDLTPYNFKIALNFK